MIYKVALLTASVVAANGSAPVTTSKSDADYIASLDAEDLSNNEATDDLQVEDYDTSEFYEDILSANHAAKVFKTNTKQNSNKFWVKFPDQFTQHVQALEKKPTSFRTTGVNVIPHDTFFTAHSDTFDLTDKTVMKLKQVTAMSNTHTIRQNYDQFFEGVRVLAGDYIVSVGAHDGVLTAHGRSYSGKSLKQSSAKFELIKKQSIDTETIHAKIKAVIMERNAKKTVHKVENLKAGRNPALQQPGHKASKANLLHEPHRYGSLSEEDIVFKDDVQIELVVHPEWAARGLTDSSLAYSVSGSVIVKGQFLSFDTCLDADTLDARVFMDKTNDFAVGFGDNEVNIFESADAQNIGAKTWDNSGAYNMDTTGTVVGDMLVDTTVQVRNMLYGLSNGVYKTWAGEQIPLDIVQITDPNFANAFYDGSRIWFGPGFETDDVIGHEWAHGYTNTMNNLIYYEDSGALNEAFSDIMGETIDILNRDTPDSVDKRMLPLDTCTTNNGYYGGIDPSFRWGMGEDVAVYGMLRDMYHPECFDHPSHFRSLLYDYYWCFDGSDGYGVHTNSGIMNKIFSTLVDGGLQELMAPTHYTVEGTKYSKGIGLLNALNLIFATYSDLAPASQFPDVAVAMETQCQLLMTGDRYVPFINDQKTMAVGPMKMHHCRKAIAIIKRAYLYDEPMDIAQCYDYCDWTDTVCT